MKDENKLALIIAYYLSRFDKIAYQNIGYDSMTATHVEIGRKIGVKHKTIKNMRDEFDPYHDNSRKGWHQRIMAPSRMELMEKYKDYSETELRKKVEAIINPNSIEQSIFNDIEAEEIDLYNKKIIEGETVERKVLSYKRNFTATTECKKRDSFTCQACGFWHENKIVECHHIKPLAMVKKSIVQPEELITLCPNCHRLAHEYIRQDVKYTDKETLIRLLKNMAG